MQCAMEVRHSSNFIDVLCDNNRYRILTIWNNEYNFDLILIDDFEAYKSIVTETIFRALAYKYEADFKNYSKDIRSTLYTNNSDNIIYKRSGEKFTISRKRGRIAVQFIDFTLNKIDFNNAVITVIDEINKSTQFHENEALKFKEQVEHITEEKNKLVQKLEEFSNLKKDMEHEFYSKFILVLNEKRLRIQYLQEMLEKLKNDNLSNETKRENLSDSDSETSIEDLNDKETILNKDISSDTESEDNPGEKIIHNVQIECKEMIQKKKLDFLDVDTCTTVKNLPKRPKISKDASPEPTKNVSTINGDNIVDDDKRAENINNEESQNSLNFNTQDLIDRL